MTSHLLFLLLHDGSSSYSVSLHHCDAFTLESTEQHADKYIFLMMLVLFFLWIVSVKNFHGHIFIKGPSALYIQDFDYLTHEQAVSTAQDRELLHIPSPFAASNSC